MANTSNINYKPTAKISRLVLILILMVTSAFGLESYAQKAEISVLTYNIRLATPDDAPNIWQVRKEKVFSVIENVEPDVFGLQEALYQQLKDLEQAFPGYERVGVGRDDGRESGEFSPVFINKQKLELTASGTFWLSQTPLVAGSRGWDAACNRVVSWVSVTEKKSGKKLFVFCTHFDHMGEVARRNSAKLLLHAVDSLAGKFPSIVIGDFNASPESEPYQLLTQKTDPLHLTDALTLCSDSKGPSNTYTGFKVGGIKGERIDYIFLKGITQVKSYTVNDANNGEYYPSDHLPVSAVLKF